METKTLHGVFVIVSTGRVEAGGGDKKLWGGILELQTKVRRRFAKISCLLVFSHFRHFKTLCHGKYIDVKLGR